MTELTSNRSFLNSIYGIVAKLRMIFNRDYLACQMFGHVTDPVSMMAMT